MAKQRNQLAAQIAATIDTILYFPSDQSDGAIYIRIFFHVMNLMMLVDLIRGLSIGWRDSWQLYHRYIRDKLGVPYNNYCRDLTIQYI